MKDSNSAPPDARRRLILDTARARFLEDGYVGAAMERVAREAGMSTATLYAAFPNKSQLFEAVVLDASAEFVATMRLVDLSSEDPSRCIHAFTHGYAAFLADPFVRAVLRLVFGERRRMPDSARAVFRHGKNEVGAPLLRCLVRHHEAGRMIAPDPAWAAGQLMGLLEHPLLINSMMLGDNHNLERSVPDIADDAARTFLARYAA